MESLTQIQFTAYLQRALIRQRQRAQARIALRENHEQPMLCDGDFVICHEPTSDIIPLIYMNLSERERNILLWHVLLHMSHTEISLQLGISVSAAQKAYQRLIPKLRTQLEESRYAI